MKNVLDEQLAELTSGDDAKAEVAAAQIAASGSKSLPALVRLLDSPDTDTRWWAIRTLAQMQEPPLDILIRFAGDEDEELRQCAILGLVHHPDERAVPILMQQLLGTEPVTVNLSASALLEIGTPAVDALLELPQDAPHLSRVEAVRALAGIGDGRCIPTLLQVMEEDSPALHYWAEKGLQKLGVDTIYFKV